MGLERISATHTAIQGRYERFSCERQQHPEFSKVYQAKDDEQSDTIAVVLTDSRMFTPTPRV